MCSLKIANYLTDFSLGSRKLLQQAIKIISATSSEVTVVKTTTQRSPSIPSLAPRAERFHWLNPRRGHVAALHRVTDFAYTRAVNMLFKNTAGPLVTRGST